MEISNAMTGPEFLEAVADAESAHGNDINAMTYRERALQWKRDRELLRRALDENDDLKARLAHAQDSAADLLANLQRTAANDPISPAAAGAASR